MNTSKMKMERIKNGLTQQDLRGITKIGLTTLVKIEKGDIGGVRVKTLEKIASALNTSIVDLFFKE
ncbi:transcriptional regulator, y4mF family [Sarcina ventriculi]|uniref:helix-turn-helix domain-containing protein n=1 Tax=Sarcina ventriculi TaxID=1267 RepID=UPI000D9882A6|nr:helix-turn-helix transcriptional regulator [Sarcina ventriculi]SPZ49725.1 transcriptional regulator, y4mF family [Sarcina ventriculi]